MTTRPIYVIPDIHGHLDQLDHALALIEADGGADAAVVFLGDYIDRGPDCRGVLDRLIAGQQAGRDWTFLKGNHDRMMQWFLEPVPRWDPHWMVGLHWFHDRIGGATTLASYGIEVSEARRYGEVHQSALAAVPSAHVEFLSRLKTHHVVDDLLFVHAGIAPDVPLEQQVENDLVWIREPFLSHEGAHPWLVVHGHTALQRARHFGNRIDLDGGAAYGRPLVPAVFEGRECWLLEKAGRVALRP
ncbi:metallophosphoesterase family protein [Litorivita sp. NS0012-18]|uniref:metallophosphoesterase family protein n=1 Tax=Litorivita sp. NS0012-18 TaxID=3127655 RepID=UPI0031097597